jgi:protein Mpv17
MVVTADSFSLLMRQNDLTTKQNSIQSNKLSTAPNTISRPEIRGSSALYVRGGGADVPEKDSTSRKLWKSYLEQLDTRPLVTKGWTSALVGSAGDILGQFLTSRVARVPFIWDVKRTVVYALVGILVGSTTVHYWFEFLDKVVADPKKVKGQYDRVFRQVLVDQTVGAVIINAGFYTVHTIINAAFNGKLFPFNSVLMAIKSKLSNEMWPTLLNNWKLWPAANFINFAFVPPQLRVLFANFISVFWSAYLSNSANRIKPA